MTVTDSKALREYYPVLDTVYVASSKIRATEQS